MHAVHCLWVLLEQFQGQMALDEWTRLEEDVSDLCSASLSETQRLNTVQRMLGTFEFLAPRSSSALGVLGSFFG